MTAQTPEEAPSATYTRWAALPPFTIDGEGSARLWADLFPEEREFWRSLDAAQEPQAELATRLRALLLDVTVAPLDARIQALRLLDEQPVTARQQPQPAPGPRADAETAAMLRADLADAEARLARWPRCPAGCSCRTGIEDDADRNECGCDGPCNGGADPALAGYEAGIASLTDQRNRVSDTADRLRGLLDDFTHAAIDYAGTPIKVRDAAKVIRKKAGLPPVSAP